MKKINVAKHSGFCFGVKMAVNKALKEAKKSTNVVMLGDIVHNEHVIKIINEAGVKVVESLNVDNPGTLLLRAHGTVSEIYEEARKKGYTIVDATCPLVLEIHERAQTLEKEGYTVVIIGDKDHDEVTGIAGHVKQSIIISTPEEVNKKIPNRLKKIGVVVQSTQNIENALNIVNILMLKCKELRFYDTICRPTKLYQAEIRSMPKENDVMIIVGSFTSANTKRLTEISRLINPCTYQVESAIDIKPEWFKNAESIGISAGSSTPDWVINEVIQQIFEIAEKQ
jgi:4-hydroxy-3-methylbut-2-enyl diphosphate reductase